MYKRVFIADGFFMAEHYPFGRADAKELKNCYGLQGSSGEQLMGVTVVASEKHDHDDRKQKKFIIFS